MKRRIFIVLVSGLFSFSIASGATSYRFEDLYQKALSTSEAISIAQGQQERSEEKLKQARGTIAPSLNLNSSYTRVDLPESGLSSSTRAEAGQVRVSGSQPLFRGLRDFAALRSANRQVESTQAATESARQLLFSQVGQAWVNLDQARKDLEILRKSRALSEQRLQEVRARVRSGKSRSSDQFAAQAQLSQIESQISAAVQTLNQARVQAQLLTGLSGEFEVESIEGSPRWGKKYATPPRDLAQRVLGERSDLVSAQKALESAEDSVTIARGAHWPSADANANYYLYQTGSFKDSKWDVALTASVPIFQGGVLSSQVREAASLRRERELQLEQSRRKAASDLDLGWSGVAQASQQVAQLQQSLENQKKTVEILQREDRLGLVGSLDVLSAMNTLTEIERSLLRAQGQWVISQINLESSLGRR
jgi:outer membrane protein